MFSSRKENQKVNKLHEIALTVLVDKTNDLFEDRDPKKSYVNIQVINIPQFTMDIFKYGNSLFPRIMNYVFTVKVITHQTLTCYSQRKKH